MNANRGSISLFQTDTYYLLCLLSFNVHKSKSKFASWFTSAQCLCSSCLQRVMLAWTSAQVGFFFAAPVLFCSDFYITFTNANLLFTHARLYITIIYHKFQLKRLFLVENSSILTSFLIPSLFTFIHIALSVQELQWQIMLWNWRLFFL